MSRFVLFIILFSVVGGFVHAQEPPKVFFSNSIMPGRYFYSHASYQAPSWIRHIQTTLPVSEKNFTPGNSLVLEYSSREQGRWQARVFYHNLRGLDHFKPATHLTFRMFVEENSTLAPGSLPLIGIGEKDKETSVYLPIGDFVADLKTGEWLKVSIPLDKLTPIKDQALLNQITFKNGGATAGQTIYIDQMELDAPASYASVAQTPVLLSAKGFEKHIDISWEPVRDPAVRYIKIFRSRDNERFLPVGIQVPKIQRYADYVDTVNSRYYYRIAFLDGRYTESQVSNAMDATTHPMNDEQLLDMVQEAHFRYYWEGAEENSGLALENIPGRQNMIASGASGFGVMAILAAAERGFITRDQAKSRCIRIVSFLEKTEKFHGAFSHFIDGPSGKVEPFFGPRDNGGDLVETSFLMQGLLAARQYFDSKDGDEKRIRDGIDKLWQNVEWSWYRRTTDNPFLLWHWSPDKEWIINHKLIGWNETMITYFLAISSPTHGIPASMYYTGWASQSDEAQKYRMNWGKTPDGKLFSNGNYYFGIPLPVGVSTGGPLFFTHYSYLGLDPRMMRDAYTNYFTNNRNIALINYRYCIENPEGHAGYGADCWGLTASDGPWRYSANEPAPSNDQGKMTPTGALASFPYTPEQSMAALKNYYRNFGSFLWGEYGFRDAFNLEENWCSEIFMGLNQAPVVVMIENHRSGLLWRLFMDNPDVQKGFQKIRSEKVRPK